MECNSVTPLIIYSDREANRKEIIPPVSKKKLEYFPRKVLEKKSQKNFWGRFEGTPTEILEENA